MWNFQEDLKKWKEWEERILQVLIENWFKLIQNPKEKELDLLIINGWIECKKDEKAQFSWNFYIEFECNWKPSWLFRPEEHELKWWAHTDWLLIYLLEANEFKIFVSNKIDECRNNKSNTSKGYKVIESGGNWGRTKGLLIPVKDMGWLARKVFNY